METSYLSLVRGNRITSYMGLRMEEGYEYKHGKNYLYVEVPVFTVLGTDDKSLQVKRNQHVYIKAACTIDVRGKSMVEIEPNSSLAEFGQIQSLYRMHPESGVQEVGFWFTARKDIDIANLTYAVRLYMPV